MSCPSPILNYQPPVSLPIPAGPSLPPPGYFYYWPSITMLTGSDALLSLQAQNISALPPNSIVEVNIAGRGASQWLRSYDNTTPATDINAGRIVPINYNSTTNPYVLIRVAGY